MTPAPLPAAVEAELRAIKAELRANMNGAASAAMRSRGLTYHLNFGIDLPRLRLIAAQFTPCAAVAQALWREDVRESRILATMLMPPAEFTPDLCRQWLRTLPNAEIAQVLTLNLLSRLPYARGMALPLMASPQPLSRLVGALLVGRMAMGGALTAGEREEFARLADAALPTADAPLRRAIHNARVRIDE